jgi:hypothetical protein
MKAISYVYAQACETPPSDGVQNTWPKYAPVKVAISSSIISSETTAMQQAFRNWESSNTCSGVTFEFTDNLGAYVVNVYKGTLPRDPLGNQPRAQVTRTHPKTRLRVVKAQAR